MARDKDLNTSIDDVVNKAKAEVNILKTQTVTLTANLKVLEDKRNKLSQEILDSEKELVQIHEESKVKAESILKSVTDKLAKANSRESEVVRKIAELDQKESEAKYLIESNQGLQKNLLLQTDIVKSNISLLKGLVASIEETLKYIK